MDGTGVVDGRGTGRASAVASGVVSRRLESIDLMRGIVMVIMALDHTRDYIHNAAYRFDPTDLTQTSAILFFTRWITHYCAPTFVFLAGTSAYLQLVRGATRSDVSRFLLTRGLWLIVLEFTVVRAGMWFNLDYSFLALMQVIWVLGVSMVVLAGLVFLPLGVIAAFGIVMVAGHNAFDGIQVPGWQPGGPALSPLAMTWILLHQSGQLLPVGGADGPLVFVMYPLIPWIGVMAAGYAFGKVFSLDAERRQWWLLRSGLGVTLAFVIIRGLNVYGDPSPWAPQASALFTLLSFVNLTKYPPSLLYLLMTLGPVMVALWWFEQRRPSGVAARSLIMFGRVPLFFYLLQWPVAHSLAIVLGLAAGHDVTHLFYSIPEFFTLAPANVGFSLPVVYASWAFVIAILFVLCRWFAGVKKKSNSVVLRYL